MADDLETAKESLILWHIATELCYSIDVTDNTGKGCNRNKYRDFLMLLSDYMLYLLVIQPTLMSKVASIGQIRFRDTCAEANKFFYEENLKRKKTHVCLGVKKFFGRGKSDEGKKQPHACPNIAKFFGRGKLERDEIHIRACQSILAVNTDVKPVTVKGDRSKSVLFDASILAKELKKLEMKYGKDKWEIISRVWVELLSYAASHCRADNHAQQLSKGGELVTLVWLLMANLGLEVQFQINE
ncbi:hypothetical protein F0562_014188 [Nyssa sinensis]|uniref:DUF4220 domain-containing protein n=1 Tax=Nyssa sinensis TaxID=561372 RepID=A0A5J4ZR34_9ASTE|nr:hypothetical protein F0562_014188 [Nyssa sinensis]